MHSGFGLLTFPEQIRLLLSYSEKGNSFAETADRLTAKYGSLHDLVNADARLLTENFGVSEQTIVLLRIIPQLSRICTAEAARICCISTSENAKAYFSGRFIGSREEELLAVCTDRRFAVIAAEKIAGGNRRGLSASYRSIADFALRNRSERIFLAHNHPVSTAKASADDISATQSVSELLSKLGISLIDHIIVGSDAVISMRETLPPQTFTGSDACGYEYRTKP